MEPKAGSIVGATLLIGGSCVGAGMLGLPIVTGLCGFFPSLIIMILAWAFMTSTALLMLEVQGWFSKDVNLITMVGHSLGKWGQKLSWLLYLFLFYSLLVAYQAGIGMDVSSMTAQIIGYSIPTWTGTSFFILLFGCILYTGTHKVDFFNRFLMTGKILTYLGIITVGMTHITPYLLTRTNIHTIFFSLPILVVSFGFHNMIPTIRSYLKGDLKRTRIAILSGSLFALFIYIVWDLIVLGIVPFEGEYGLIASLQSGKDASVSIAGILGSSWVTFFASGLAFFSLLTSLLLQSLALVHFLADGFQTKDKESVPLILLVFIPPFLLSILKPEIFFKALNFAGGICAVILFGLIPVFMVWRGRYQMKLASIHQMIGGKLTLICILIFALSIFIFQLMAMTGFISISTQTT